jgi:replicative DNA helicase
MDPLMDRLLRRRGARRGLLPPVVVDPPQMAGRVPPHDLDAEGATLSASMLDKAAMEVALDILKPEHFYSEANARIFQAIQQLAITETKVDLVSVSSWLRDREWLQKMGGTAYLAQLADATPAVAHVAAHAKVVYEKWRLRQLIATCQLTAAEAYGDVGEVQTFITSHAEATDALVLGGEERQALAPVGSALKTAFEQISAAAERGDRITGTPTGYDRLDAKTAGLHDGDLVIVAARPGMGKAQTTDSRVLTPDGWRAIGALQVGDVISGPWGLPQQVTGVFPQGTKNVFVVHVDGGRQTRCCDEHLWWAAVAQVADTRRPSPRVYTTAELRTALRAGMAVMLPVSPKANSGGWPGWHEVESIEPAGEAECVCIAVSSPRQLYVTDDFIVTHNTSFVLNVATNVASPRTITLPATADRAAKTQDEPGLGVCVFSLEMPREQLAVRMVCSEGRVDLGRLRQGHLHADDWRKLTEAGSYLSSLPLWIDDTPGITLQAIRSKVRRLKAGFDRAATETTPARRVGMVMVDYLQLMRGRDGVQSREQEISEISRGLKGLAKELKVSVIALSQLNRAVETRTTKDKRPQLSDLRESGAIEQDADTIIFIYRDDYYNPETSDLKGIAELIIAKQRNGPTGKVKVRFSASCTRFDNLEPGDYPEETE